MGLSELFPILSDIRILGPQLLVLFGQFRRSSLAGGNLSLGAGFENSKIPIILHLLPLLPTCDFKM